jgi:hypothetical protein
MGRMGGAAPAGRDAKQYLRGSEALLLSAPHDSLYGNLATALLERGSRTERLRPPADDERAVTKAPRWESRQSVRTPNLECTRARPSPLVSSRLQRARLPLHKTLVRSRLAAHYTCTSPAVHGLHR